ncbi:probable LRR receptor-like serine/threonine-protein kinase At3g47570 [Cucumis melo]|uniref:Probable LRR receptor-like serine/threonine-protein kinase At3g47570 n=1 Tax=Cucumis melo TaxID=3656 RepID=A0ABM3KQY9_CUCME|nr:probable LRR receptor-like serine/threonine-protein kinase At3g47570 [Cucumis melo]XP_050940199.1 probable LRR receptor-like serine/threonine-protein kinase At3g47570 [Cucumis melo]XP_050940200.1 probable LRR receptor-like serine/threonine-protein kinase At3g47570 [Cucumis melo]XP_050940201.1 probable LRR receptor-like serine/threonine-protein kinase At3g47570 [Cucumis melo]XP_050940202.1 probable LRR receptor-like serine/threonine-protein kinase At3g47570 [Cucumis melo]XP_050940203.1 proba
MRHSCCIAKIFLHTFLCYIFLMSRNSASRKVSTFGNESDRSALLDLKRRVLNDPLKIMSSWNDSVHFCDWAGVTCSPTIRKVMVLNLEARQLTGSIPSSLGNLTHLTEIRLGDNNFLGPIPQELGKLLLLRHLNLSFNDFDGEVASNISHCTELLVLELSLNEFVGQIPHQFFTLSKLERLGFGGNNLVGTIPPWIGNFSSLTRLSFALNNFQGSIPSELGRLSRLKLFSVYGNYLTGTVPPSIYNITSLTYFSLTQNRLLGTLPPDVGFTLPNLQVFAGGVNNFGGPIPTSLANISGLQVLDFAENSLIGTLPHDLGNLKELVRFNFDDNRLGSGNVDDLNVIRSLTNCTSLSVLGLSGNRFGGTLPLSIGNLSNQLTILTLGRNLLSGGIPVGIDNLINLQVLGVEGNNLNGSVPSNIGKLHNLGFLSVHNNKLSGTIPSSIGNLSLLTKLFMEDNRLEGSIPPNLGQCKRLQVLDLSGNNLSGTIPKEVLSLSSLSIYLALNHNTLTGPLPREVGDLVSLTLLDVSQNKLSGGIPSDLGKCISMVHLYLGGNQFEGTIPKSLKALKGLEELNLSSNNLFGPIPQFLGNLFSLKFLDLSYNNFEGKVAKEGIFSNSTMFSILGNNNLCDGLEELHLPSCTSNRTRLSNKLLTPKVLIPLVSTLTFLVIFLSILSVCFMIKKSRKNVLTSAGSLDLLSQISYLELNRWTNGFSVENLIGSGNFGSVYKGILLNDKSVVAVKVINLQQRGASKSFVDECSTLTNIRHRNLLKIITSCSSTDEKGNEFKAIVFDFMSNGNLDSWLHPTHVEKNKRKLSFIQRLDIAIDVANALDYLHNHCETPIVHCDLKPSNVLLDDDMVGHVGDFGLARFILEGSNHSVSRQTMSIALKGSIGYIPPEYGTGGNISIEGDIFSYGILLLEMFTGKRPTDSLFCDGVDIHLFTAKTLPHGVLDIVDHSLLSEVTCQQEEDNKEKIQTIAIMSEEDQRDEQKRMEEYFVSIMRIGLSCSSTTPRERMPMNIVVKELQTIKRSYHK